MTYVLIDPAIMHKIVVVTQLAVLLLPQLRMVRMGSEFLEIFGVLVEFRCRYTYISKSFLVVGYGSLNLYNEK
jgi:hypothetical protein